MEYRTVLRVHHGGALYAADTTGIFDCGRKIWIDPSGYITICPTDFYVTEDGTVIPANQIKSNSQYDRIEIEIKSGKAVRPQNAIDDWNDFLGPNQTNIDQLIPKKQKSSTLFQKERGFSLFTEYL